MSEKKYTDKEVEQIFLHTSELIKRYKEIKLEYPQASIDDIIALYKEERQKELAKTITHPVSIHPQVDLEASIGTSFASMDNYLDDLFENAWTNSKECLLYLCVGSLPEKYRKHICEKKGWDEIEAADWGAGVQFLIGGTLLGISFFFPFNSLLILAGIYAQGESFFRACTRTEKTYSSSPLVNCLVSLIEKKCGPFIPEEKKKENTLLPLYKPKLLTFPNQTNIILQLEIIEPPKGAAVSQEQWLAKAHGLVTAINNYFTRVGVRYQPVNQNFLTSDNGLMVIVNTLLENHQEARKIGEEIDEKTGQMAGLYRQSILRPDISTLPNAVMAVAHYVLGDREKAGTIMKNIHTKIGRTGFLYFRGLNEMEMSARENCFMALGYYLLEREDKAKQIVEAIETKIGTREGLYRMGVWRDERETAGNGIMALMHHLIGDKEEALRVIDSIEKTIGKEGELYKTGRKKAHAPSLFDNGCMAMLFAVLGGARLKA